MEISAVVRNVNTGIEKSIHFPISINKLKKALDLDEERDLEYIIVDSTCPYIKEYDSINIINAFAELVEDVDEKLLKAVHDVTGYNAKDIIDYDFDFSECYLLPDVNTKRELGEHWFNELGSEGVGKEKMETYFDYQAYGRDIDIESEGGFTDYGYLEIRG